MSYHMKKARKRTRLFGDLTGTFTYNSQRSNITTAERLCDCSDKPSLLIRASLVGKVAYDSTIPFVILSNIIGLWPIVFVIRDEAFLIIISDNFHILIIRLHLLPHFYSDIPTFPQSHSPQLPALHS